MEEEGHIVCLPAQRDWDLPNYWSNWGSLVLSILLGTNALRWGRAKAWASNVSWVCGWGLSLTDNQLCFRVHFPWLFWFITVIVKDSCYFFFSSYFWSLLAPSTPRLWTALKKIIINPILKTFWSSCWLVMMKQEWLLTLEWALMEASHSCVTPVTACGCSVFMLSRQDNAVSIVPMQFIPLVFLALSWISCCLVPSLWL